MTLLRLDYLIHSLGNCEMTLPTETGLRILPRFITHVTDIPPKYLIVTCFVLNVNVHKKQ